MAISSNTNRRRRGTIAAQRRTLRREARTCLVVRRDGRIAGKRALRREAAVYLAVLAVLVSVWLIPGVATAGELIMNGSFETGDFGPYWVHGAYRGNNYNPSFADHIVVPDMPYTGSYSTRIGFKDSREKRSAVGFMYQDVTIPSNISGAALFFRVRQQGYDTDPFDPFAAQIRSTNNAVLETVMELTFIDPSFVFKDSGWIEGAFSPAGFDVTAYAGQTVRVYFEQANTNDNLYETWAYVDDVSLAFRKFVDLIVDANGNDTFGALGTGDGGIADGSTFSGDTMDFDLDVENEGVDTDSYVLSVAGPLGWSVWLTSGAGEEPFPYTTSAVASGDVERYRVFAVPPPGTPAGPYNIILDAVSAVHGNRFDSVRLRVNVVEGLYGADLIVDGNGFGVTGEEGSGGFAIKAGQWNETVSYAIELLNSGNTAAAYEMSVTGDPGTSAVIWYQGTSYAAPFTTQAVPAGSMVAMTLDVSVAYPEPGGDYRTIVRASALPDTLKKDSITALLRLQAPRVDMIIGTSGNDIYDDTFSGLGGASSNASERGVDVYFPVTIQNESDLADSFELSWVRPTGNWSAVIVSGGVEYRFPFTTPTIPAN